MKKLILKAFSLLVLAGGVSSCGDEFLETDYFGGIDVDTGLSNVTNIGTALNGTYYRLYYYPFAGNYAIILGDISTDLAYWNTSTSHLNSLYQYTVLDTDIALSGIWNYGYKVADNASRVIQAGNALYGELNEAEKAELDIYLAEAYALRAYAHLMLVNIYGHQVKVNGTDFSSEPGIVVIDTPIQAFTEVSRSTVGRTYEAIVADFKASLDHFTAAGGDRGSVTYFNRAAVYGLLARTQLYLEDWDNAAENAQKALDAAGITSLAYTADTYQSLYSATSKNVETLFALAITGVQNWSANSAGTMWSTYSYGPSPYLLSLYADTDCRTSIMSMASAPGSTSPEYNGGKYSVHTSGNPAYATNYIVNAPEMFLIIAEANAKSPSGSLAAAQQALLTVAKRNSAITTADQVGTTKDEVLSFLKEERARELFQEGLRLYDLRRWDESANVYAYKAPDIAFTYTGYKISNLVYPIPVDEINSGFGVTQNDWSSTMPK